MLNMVNITSIREIELYIEVVQVKAQVNQYVGGHIDLLVRDNYNIAEFDYGCGPNSGLVPDTRVYGDDVSTNPDAEILDESSPVHYHLPPTAQFKHVENLGNAISSAWTPWVQHSTGYSSEEFVVGQVFNSKSDFQEAAKIYSIKAHQEFVVVASSKKLFILRCKKAEEC